jgi:hypothetical protein
LNIIFDGILGIVCLLALITLHKKGKKLSLL